jgi:serine O-acetyltransferase
MIEILRIAGSGFRSKMGGLNQQNEQLMRFNEYRFLIRSDLYRYTGDTGGWPLLKYTWGNPCFKYSFWMRTCAYLKQSGKWYHIIAIVIARRIFRHYVYKYGISIPYITKIGSGLVIGHFSGIFVSEKSVIGKNCTIAQGVTVGKANRGKNKGYPTIGDNVYIGAGAKIIGKVKVGDNVAIGANCVVTKDVPDNAVVAGVPGKIISYNGSEDYLENTDYPEFIYA